jgi:hypothetical protein
VTVQLRVCASPQCVRPHKARGYCSRCYKRLRKRGDLERLHYQRPSRTGPVDTSAWSPELVAWVAGIVEGEGSIGLMGGGRVVVAMTDEDIIRRLESSLGIGFVYPRPRKESKPHWKSVWQWAVSRIEELEALLTHISSWLGHRRLARADRVLQHLKTRRKVHGTGT